MENMIKITDLNKYYDLGKDKLHVLKDINFNVVKGEFIAILGPSGSGKSTLMNIIGGMDDISSGTYVLNGESIEKANEKKLAKIRNEKIGFIFQKYHLISKYDVLQNVMMPLLIRGVDKKIAREKALENLILVGLEGRLKHKPKELSGGQQQRVAIARALVSEPSILLADEPTGALDSETGKEILELFKKLNDNGNTIIMITHDKEIANWSNRIIKIIDGKILI